MYRFGQRHTVTKTDFHPHAPHIRILACDPAAFVLLLGRARAVTYCMHVCKLAPV